MANEKRLISADVAKEMIVNHANEFSDVLNRREKALLIGGGTSCIDKCPTVDAVEVVRCAKCKHYQQYHKGRTEELCEWGKCKLISMDVDMPCNGFCCFGERRNDHVQKPV